MLSFTEIRERDLPSTLWSVVGSAALVLHAGGVPDPDGELCGAILRLLCEEEVGVAITVKVQECVGVGDSEARESMVVTGKEKEGNNKRNKNE